MAAVIPRLLGRFQLADRIADWVTDGALTALREEAAWWRADAADVRARLHLALAHDTKGGRPKPLRMEPQP